MPEYSSSAGQPDVTLTYGHDSDGNRITLADNLSSAGRTTYSYDAADRLTTIAASYGGTAGPVVGFGYDAAGRLTSLSRTIGGSGTDITSSYAYDNDDRLTAITHQVVGGSTLASYTYDYDDASRLVGETNAEGAISYTYDADDQLTGTSGSSAATYTYDGNGNRTMSGYSTTTDNEMSSGAGYTYTYDNEGNLISKTQTSTGDVWTYTYDYHNDLTGVVEKNSYDVVLMRGTYTYDPLDRRIETDEKLGGDRPRGRDFYGLRRRESLRRIQRVGDAAGAIYLRAGREPDPGANVGVGDDGLVPGGLRRFGARHRGCVGDGDRPHRLRRIRQHHERERPERRRPV